MSKFYPKMYQKNIYDINYSKLKETGLDCLIFDLDNTIALIDQNYVEKRCCTLFQHLKTDFELVILSNNMSQKRVEKYAKILDCDCVYSAKKPFLFGIKKVARKYHLSENKIAVIGDQLVTDIFLANRYGAFPILVDPMGEKDLKITAVNRMIEKRILNSFSKKGILKKGEYYE